MKQTVQKNILELSAIKSTMSGEFYMIYRKGEPVIKCQGGILRELDNYRSKNANYTFNIDFGDAARFLASLCCLWPTLEVI